MVAKVSRLSAEEMRRVSDFKLKWREEGFQTCFVSIPIMIPGFDGQLSSSTQVGWFSMAVPC